jgi:hypothetical protein
MYSVSAGFTSCGKSVVLGVPLSLPAGVVNLNILLSAEAVAAAPLAVIVNVPLMVQLPVTYTSKALQRLSVVNVSPELTVRDV